MNLREEVVSEWIELKEKIDEIKFSESDKLIIDYLENCDLNFNRHLIDDYDKLSEWEMRILKVSDELRRIEPESDLLTSWKTLASCHAQTIFYWIDERRRTIFFREEVRRINPTSPSLELKFSDDYDDSGIVEID